MKVLDRLVYSSPGKFQNFLMLPFLIYTAAYGVAFVFFAHTATVQVNTIFKLTEMYMPGMSVGIFGALLLFVTIGNVIGMIIRKGWLGNLVSMLGFLCWTYAAIILGLHHFWLQIIILALPHMMFWGWYYYTINVWHRIGSDKP